MQGQATLPLLTSLDEVLGTARSQAHSGGWEGGRDRRGLSWWKGALGQAHCVEKLFFLFRSFTCKLQSYLFITIRTCTFCSCTEATVNCKPAVPTQVKTKQNLCFAFKNTSDQYKKKTQHKEDKRPGFCLIVLRFLYFYNSGVSNWQPAGQMGHTQATPIPGP